MNLKKKILTPPAHIELSQRRYFSLGNSAALGGFLGHLVLLLSFIFFEIIPMALLNVGSVGLFAYTFFLNRQGKHTWVIWLSILEIVLHAIFAVLLLGWDSGFHYYLSLVFVVVFLQKKEFDKLGIWISFFNLLIYLLLFAYCMWWAKPMLQIAGNVKYFYHINNLVVSSIIIALGAFYYKSTANQIENQLENAYKKITSSIRYAQRIQQSILPQNEILENYFQEYFIWYQPKDIVSGDFYWFKAHEHQLSICAIDCTGHGVPGAFMTVLAKALLKNIIQDQSSPAAILETLHQQVVRALRQDEGFSQDGMDMAICIFDFEKKEFRFSGAMNPIFYSQNNEIFELKGTKRPIGGMQNRKFVSFQEIVLPLEKNMCFYFFSDGITDQFKDNENQKFGKKRLMEFFRTEQKLPMSQQGEKLQQKLKEWIGTGKQIDDILVLGLRY